MEEGYDLMSLQTFHSGMKTIRPVCRGVPSFSVISRPLPSPESCSPLLYPAWKDQVWAMPHSHTCNSHTGLHPSWNTQGKLPQKQSCASTIPCFILSPDFCMAHPLFSKSSDITPTTLFELATPPPQPFQPPFPAPLFPKHFPPCCILGFADYIYSPSSPS